MTDDPASTTDSLPIHVQPLPRNPTPDERLDLALRLRADGSYTWRQIAKLCRWKNADTARLTVQQYLDKAALHLEPAERARRLQLEFERLDQLQAPHWGPAMQGDLKASEFVLKVIQTRIRLLTLEEDTKTSATYQTIIVSDQDMADDLRRIAEGDTP